MGVPLELLDKFQTTFLDFWRLRPRTFLTQASVDRARYMPPAQFVGTSSILLLAMLVVDVSLSHGDLEKLAGEKIASPEALAGRLLVFVIFILFLNTIFSRIISPQWPIRGRATLISIFEFQCYMTATLVPAGAIDVLLDPLLLHIVLNGAPYWILYIPLAIGYVLGLIFYFVYQNPGLAHLNGVSSLRMLLGTILWSTVLMVALGALAGVVWFAFAK